MAKKSAFSIPEIKAFWASKSVKRSKGKNDRLEKNAGGVTYYLFGNAIAHYDPGTHTLKLSDARLSVRHHERPAEQPWSQHQPEGLHLVHGH